MIGRHSPGIIRASHPENPEDKSQKISEKKIYPPAKPAKWSIKRDNPGGYLRILSPHKLITFRKNDIKWIKLLPGIWYSN